MPWVEFTEVTADDAPQQNALLTLKGRVDEGWIDYNGHMTEWQYYKVLADAGENFLRAAGFTEDYRASGYSFFSVEGHLRNLRECRLGSVLDVYTEMLGYDNVRLHIYQYVLDSTRGITVATGEHMMLHVDTRSRRSCAMPRYMSACLETALAEWRPEREPRGLGKGIARSVGVNM